MGTNLSVYLLPVIARRLNLNRPLYTLLYVLSKCVCKYLKIASCLLFSEAFLSKAGAKIGTIFQTPKLFSKFFYFSFSFLEINLFGSTRCLYNVFAPFPFYPKGLQR